MEKFQILLNLGFIITLILAFRWLSQLSHNDLLYQNQLLLALDEYISSGEISENQLPPELADKNFIDLTNTEAFLKIIQLSQMNYKDEELKIPQGLSLNNRHQPLHFGQILSILLANDSQCKFLKDLQKEYLREKYGGIMEKKESRFCILVHMESLVNEEKIKKLLQSIMDQEYQNYNVIYVDDGAPGSTFMIARSFILDLNREKFSDKFIFQMNKEPVGLIENMNKWMNEHCESEDVGLLLQSDSFLVSPQALRILNYMHVQKPVGLGAGQQIIFPSFTVDKNDQFVRYEKDQFIRNKMDESLQTFQVGEIFNLPANELTNLNTKKFFKSEAPTALFYSLIERVNRDQYGQIPEIVMARNVEYESPQKMQQRQAVKDLIVSAHSHSEEI